MKYVILRSSAAHAAEPDAVGRPRAFALGTAAAVSPLVEVSELAPRSAANLAHEANVSVAPVVPMKLIEPFVADGLAAEPSGSIAWGVKAVGADTSPFDGDGIVPAVLDTGIDPNHAAFDGVELVRKNFTEDADDDEHGHGTHCAGTIFGRSVNGTRIGVAPGVKKALIGKVLGKTGGGSDKIIEAIQWAITNGANVISMSLGIDFPGLVKELEQQGFPTDLATSVALDGYRTNVLLFQAMANLVAQQDAFIQPTLIVAAAGNESRRQVDPKFEIAVSPPAVADGIVSVAALGQSPQGFVIAPFSNTGARLSGPGVDIISAKRGGGLTTMSGTSMATPHVAGVTTLWAQKLSLGGALRASTLAARLIGNATTLGLATGFDPGDVGTGMVLAPQA